MLQIYMDIWLIWYDLSNIIFWIQKKVKQIDELYKKQYRFCGHKVAYGEQLATFNSWKNQYLNHFSRLKGSWKRGLKNCL